MCYASILPVLFAFLSFHDFCWKTWCIPNGSLLKWLWFPWLEDLLGWGQAHAKWPTWPHWWHTTTMVLSTALKISVLYYASFFKCAHFEFSSNQSNLAISTLSLSLQYYSLLHLHWRNKCTTLGGSHQIRFTLKCSTNSSLICLWLINSV